MKYLQSMVQVQRIHALEKQRQLLQEASGELGEFDELGAGQKQRRSIWGIFGLLILCLTVAGLVAMSKPVSAAAFERDQPTKTTDKKSTTEKPRAAIVIDDFGNNMQGTKEMLALPFRFTAAVMPFMPSTKQDAEAAYAAGHDVIVHMPMEPNKGLRKWLGPGAITTDLSDAEIKERIERAIADVPHAIGMNNHMGSKVTSDPRVMKIILDTCRENGLFFLDSRTSYKTVIPKLSEELNLTYVYNQLFMDDQYTREHVNGQAKKLVKLLNEGDCIAIGHVGPPGMFTSAALRQVYEQNAKHFEFVPLSVYLGLTPQLDPQLP